MRTEVAVLVRRHNLSEACREDLLALVTRIREDSDTVVDDPAAAPSLDLGFASFEDTADPSTLRPRVDSADRYVDLGLIGVGGMGEVRRVRDTVLNRTMAMKIIRPPHGEGAVEVARFVEEAQATAQLQHPGIVPVHELGELEDGRLYFTMREVHGRELTRVLREVHAHADHRWRPAPSGWTFRRLVAAFQQVCATVAYAHSRGVIHRDLKPGNVMLGAFGEALVVDWGLAKVQGRADLAARGQEQERVVTDRSLDDALATHHGTVAGTPAYMPPEQALGHLADIDARSDVYALGAILYEVLFGVPPYIGPTAGAVLEQVRAGPPWFVAPWEDEWSDDTEGPPVPEELVQVCRRAMAREPSERHQSASELAGDVLAWLDGIQRRERALEIVAQADARLEEAAELRERAAQAEASGATLLEGVEPWQTEEVKGPGWAELARGARLRAEAELSEVAYRETLHGALNHAPDLAEAHERLADLHRRAHSEAERQRDERGASQAEALVRHHDRAGRHSAYLRGDGALTLVTEPPGATVLLHRYELRHKRLVPVLDRTLGRTPLESVPLPMGSYLCTLQHPERCEVRYPVSIAREAHWDGARPGALDPHPVLLPASRDLGPSEAYVPAGWFTAGDGVAHGSVPAGTRLWCNGFAMRRFPVTNAEYLAFLNDLVAQGRADEALQWAPRERGGTEGEQGPVIYGRGADGRFALRPDADGDSWELEWPVLMVDWACARAFAAWASEQTGHPWRLPADFEWEKAARGVDGRTYPWGDGIDPSYCCYRDSHAGRPLPRVVDTFPIDRSAYGIRGLGGNVQGWCADAWTQDGALPVDGIVHAHGADELGPRVCRGGVWSGIPDYARCARRIGVDPGNRHANLGFRLVRSIGPPSDS